MEDVQMTSNGLPLKSNSQMGVITEIILRQPNPDAQSERKKKLAVARA